MTRMHEIHLRVKKLVTLVLAILTIGCLTSSKGFASTEAAFSDSVILMSEVRDALVSWQEVSGLPSNNETYTAMKKTLAGSRLALDEALERDGDISAALEIMDQEKAKMVSFFRDIENKQKSYVKDGNLLAILLRASLFLQIQEAHSSHFQEAQSEAQPIIGEFIIMTNQFRPSFDPELTQIINRLEAQIPAELLLPQEYLPAAGHPPAPTIHAPQSDFSTDTRPQFG